MHYNAASTLFNKADVNRESEFSQRSSNAFGERIASSSTNRIIDDFPRVTNGDANAVFDQMHLNRNNFNERNRVGSGENTFNGASSITDNARRCYSPDSGEHTFGGASSITDNTRRYYSPDSGKHTFGGASSITDNARRYYSPDSGEHTFGGASSITDNARRYYSPDSGEHTFGGASSITDNARRYYSPDSGDLFIDPNPEIITRPDPRQPPTYTQKVTIRYLQPPPLPPSNQNNKEVHPPAPPSTTLSPQPSATETLPNAPNRLNNIILERWFLYEPGSVPQKSIAHPFERLVVTPVDPQTYMKQNSINPIDSAVFVQQGRNAGGVNNISPPSAVDADMNQHRF